MEPSPRRTFQFAALLAPLLLFAFALTLPYSSARLSLILHGYPFAHVVQKENLDIFKFVQTDSFSYKAVVFSGGKAVGMIDQPTFDLAHFESFPIQENSVDLGFPKWLYGLLLISWYFRWWLLPAQLIILLLWLLQREKKDQHSNL